ncbi:hypothetical protein EJB05_06496, partial [Eragrostis curvula]
MKLLGTLVCVGGTMMVSLLKGSLLHMWPTNLLRYAHTQEDPANTTGAHRDMVAGTLWLCGSCLSYALYFVVQERLVKEFPSTYLMATRLHPWWAACNLSWWVPSSSTTEQSGGSDGTSSFSRSSIRVLGTVLVVVGMYAFLWGKGTELKLSSISSTTAAVLQEEVEP